MTKNTKFALIIIAIMFALKEATGSNWGIIAGGLIWWAFIVAQENDKK